MYRLLIVNFLTQNTTCPKNAPEIPKPNRLIDARVCFSFNDLRIEAELGRAAVQSCSPHRDGHSGTIIIYSYVILLTYSAVSRIVVQFTNNLKVYSNFNYEICI